MSKERLKEKSENQYTAKVDKIFGKYRTKGDEMVWNIPEEVPSTRGWQLVGSLVL